MNLNGLLNQFTRILTNRLMNWGINKSIRTATRRGSGTTPSGKPTPQARKQEQTAREAVKRARQAARITRRMGR